MPKNILIVTKHLNIGGAEKMLLRMLPIMLSLNYKVDIFLLYKSGLLLQSWANTYQNNTLCTLSSFFPYEKDEFKKFMKNHPDEVYQQNIFKKYDVEIAFQESYATKIVSNSPNKNSIKIAWIHSNFEEYHFSADAYENNSEELKTYQKYNKIVFCSFSAMHAFDQVLKNNFKNKDVIYSPIRIAQCNYYAEQYPVSLDKPYFLVLTRFSPQKGLDRIIKAGLLLKAKKISYRIIIVGSGELEDQIHSLLSFYALNNHILLYPATPNPFPYLKNCIAYINSSYTESFGIAIQEALCMNIPVIAYDTAGAREVLGGGSYGEIIPPSEHILAETLERCLGDTNYLNELQEKARKGGDFWNDLYITSHSKIELLLSPNTGIR